MNCQQLNLCFSERKTAPDDIIAKLFLYAFILVNGREMVTREFFSTYCQHFATSIDSPERVTQLISSDKFIASLKNNQLIFIDRMMKSERIAFRFTDKTTAYLGILSLCNASNNYAPSERKFLEKFHGYEFLR